MNHVVCHFVELYVPSPSLDIVTMQNEEIFTSETRFCYPYRPGKMPSKALLYLDFDLILSSSPPMTYAATNVATMLPKMTRGLRMLTRKGRS